MPTVVLCTNLGAFMVDYFGSGPTSAETDRTSSTSVVRGSPTVILGATGALS